MNPGYKALDVGIALGGLDLGMRLSQNDVARKRIKILKACEGIDRHLQTLARADQAPRQYYRPGPGRQGRATEADSRPVWNHSDFGWVDQVAVYESPIRCISHHDRPLREIDDLLQNRPLAWAGSAQHCVEGDDRRYLET